MQKFNYGHIRDKNENQNIFVFYSKKKYVTANVFEE